VTGGSGRSNTARFVIEATLERFGLAGDGSWTETEDARVFVGTSHECEAVATALAGTGLRIERTATSDVAP
jgi:hypothetical protein